MVAVDVQNLSYTRLSSSSFRMKRLDGEKKREKERKSEIHNKIRRWICESKKWTMRLLEETTSFSKLQFITVILLTVFVWSSWLWCSFYIGSIYIWFLHWKRIYFRNTFFISLFFFSLCSQDMHTKCPPRLFTNSNVDRFALEYIRHKVWGFHFVLIALHCLIYVCRVRHECHSIQHEYSLNDTEKEKERV